MADDNQFAFAEFAIERNATTGKIMLRDANDCWSTISQEEAEGLRAWLSQEATAPANTILAQSTPDDKLARIAKAIRSKVDRAKEELGESSYLGWIYRELADLDEFVRRPPAVPPHDSAPPQQAEEPTTDRWEPIADFLRAHVPHEAMMGYEIEVLAIALAKRYGPFQERT